MSLRTLLAYQWRTCRRELLGTVGLAVTIAVFLVQIPTFLQGGTGNFLTVLTQHLWVMGLLLVVTWPGRTVPLRTLVAFFFVGVYPVAIVSILLTKPLLWLFGETFLSFVGVGLPKTLFVPLLEETFKALPVGLFFWFAARRGGFQPSISDGLLLAFAVGAGFALHEDMIAARSVGNGLSLSLWGLLLPTSAKIGGGFFGGGVYRWALGHAGWNALVGLAIGFTFLYRGHLRGAARWAVVAAALGLVAADHGNINYSGPGDAFVNRIFLNGQLTMILLWLGIAAAILIEVSILGATIRRRDYFPAVTPARQLQLVPPRTLAGLVELRAVRLYQRVRRSGYFALWRWRHQAPTPEAARTMLSTWALYGALAGAWPYDQVGPRGADPTVSRDP